MFLSGHCFGTVHNTLKDSQCPRDFSKDSTSPYDSATQYYTPKLVLWHTRCLSFLVGVLGLGTVDSSGFVETVLRCDLKHWPDPERGDFDTAVERIGSSGVLADALEEAEALGWSLERIWIDLRFFLIQYYYSSYDSDRQLCSVTGDMDTTVAWVPTTARTGDRVCNVYGALYPFVVRQYGSGGSTLLGDAYV